MATTKRYDVKDLALAPEGIPPHRVGRQADARPRRDPRPLRAGAAAWPATASPRAAAPTWPTETARPDADAQGRRRGRRLSAPRTRCPPRTTSLRRWAWTSSTSPWFAIKGEDNDRRTTRTSRPRSDHKPQLTMDDGADVIGVLHSARREQLGDIIAGTEDRAPASSSSKRSSRTVRAISLCTCSSAFAAFGAKATVGRRQFGGLGPAGNASSAIATLPAVRPFKT